jgi:hypothetical protein
MPLLLIPDHHWIRFCKRLPVNIRPIGRLPANWKSGELVMTGSSAGLNA